MKLPAPLQQRWLGASARERQLLLGAAALVLGALLWWVGVAPALTTLRLAQNQRQQLEAQLQQMQRLQAQVKALQAQPVVTQDEARRLLEASLKSLGGGAQLTQLGERFTVTLKGVSADALAQWLTQLRLTVRSVPTEVRLVRNSAASWDGTLVLSIK